MKAADVLRLRLARQGLARPAFTTPEGVVSWFGAMQAQDYLGSLWAIGLRTVAATEAQVEAAESRRAIVRTWPMRGTLHFVAAEDARWMTRLLAPRVIAKHSARWQREFGMDARMISRADEVVARALEGGQRLSRDAMYEALESRRIRTGNSRGLHLLLCLAMQGRVCLAGRDGKQHTFALLDEWLPKSRDVSGEEALVELAQRYFTSHGPATLKDFAWWAGLTLREARIAAGGVPAVLTKASIEGIDYWWHDDGKLRTAKPAAAEVRLLPAYDEFTVAYHDRALLLDGRAPASKMSLLSPAVLVDGRVAGSWKRVLGSKDVKVEVKPTRKFSTAECVALRKTVGAYGNFLGRRASLAN
ncbi:MAG TPA: winged helix DNA-binding domain-containing protein [Steroidobacteraceae bacterium]|nr:winged helix DNA-binding domain-containing protein [Steroidobacteraceae bacterium]